VSWCSHHAGQVTLTVSSAHGEQHLARRAYLRIAGFMARLRQSAEQLDALGRWHRILSDERIKIVGRECPRIAAEFLEKTRQKLGPTLYSQDSNPRSHLRHQSSRDRSCHLDPFRREIFRDDAVPWIEVHGEIPRFAKPARLNSRRRV
jgi:hypothetical protein